MAHLAFSSFSIKDHLFVKKGDLQSLKDIQLLLPSYFHLSKGKERYISRVREQGKSAINPMDTQRQSFIQSYCELEQFLREPENDSSRLTHKGDFSGSLLAEYNERMQPLIKEIANGLNVQLFSTLPSIVRHQAPIIQSWLQRDLAEGIRLYFNELIHDFEAYVMTFHCYKRLSLYGYLSKIKETINLTDLTQQFKNDNIAEINNRLDRLSLFFETYNDGFKEKKFRSRGIIRLFHKADKAVLKNIVNLYGSAEENNEKDNLTAFTDRSRLLLDKIISIYHSKNSFLGRFYFN